MNQENSHQDPLLFSRTQVMNLLWLTELILMGIFVLWLVFFYKKGLWEILSPGLFSYRNWLLGVGTGLALLLFSSLLFWVSREYRQVVFEVRSLLIQPIGYGDILVLALLSGVIEELFFRGFLQNEIGVILASIIFGLLHTGFSRRYLPYTLWALTAGLILGYSYLLTQAIIVPIVAHILNNLVSGILFKKYCPPEASASHPQD